MVEHPPDLFGISIQGMKASSPPRPSPAPRNRAIPGPPPQRLTTNPAPFPPPPLITDHR